jgi:ABC-type dipeptide/oligopeptide/nickel transport system permease component
MPSLLKFFSRRLFFMLITFVVVTALLYGVLMLAPVEARALLYIPQGARVVTTKAIENVIELHGLNDPYPVQYFRWLGNLLQGDWGYSPSMGEDVLQALLRRTPVTAELTLYSILLFIPLGLASGVIAARSRGQRLDHRFRFMAFVATSIPPFILGLVLIALFYVGLHWFPVGRASIDTKFVVDSLEFRSYTGLLTVDGILNRRIDVSLDALRHLVLPVFTLSISHWATLGRVTRATMIEELSKEYITAARARGIWPRRVLWRHALRNTLPPALNSIALSAATLVTGVFVVEVIFTLPGVSEPLNTAIAYTPDIAAAMGFAVFGVTLVLILMSVLDILLAVVNPRIREEVLR